MSKFIAWRSRRQHTFAFTSYTETAYPPGRYRSNQFHLILLLDSNVINKKTHKNQPKQDYYIPSKFELVKCHENFQTKILHSIFYYRGEAAKLAHAYLQKMIISKQTKIVLSYLFLHYLISEKSPIILLLNKF